jgi:hypothetical protein
MSARPRAGIRSDEVSPMSWHWVALLSLLAGCELRGLTHAQLHGDSPDAGSPQLDATPAPAPDGAMPLEDSAPPMIVDARADQSAAPSLDADPASVIVITGSVRTNCGSVDAKVGAGGKHTCAYDGKGSYILRVVGFRTGNIITITAEKPGFRPAPYSALIKLDANGTTHDIELTFDGPCEQAKLLPKCVCTAADRCDPS